MTLWLLSGFVSWLILRAVLIWDDSRCEYIRRWKRTFLEEYREVSFSGLIWLVGFLTLGYFSLFAGVTAAGIILLGGLLEGIDFSWLGKRAFSLYPGEEE